MAYTDVQAAIDAIDAAIAGGAVLESMTFADQTFVFRSIDDMLKARAHFVGLLQAESGTVVRRRFAATSKGV